MLDLGNFGRSVIDIPQIINSNVSSFLQYFTHFPENGPGGSPTQCSQKQPSRITELRVPEHSCSTEGTVLQI